MASIKFDYFKKILDEFDVFNIDALKVLYSKFGKEIIDGHFERYYNSLDETEIDDFVKKFAAFFEQKEKDEESMNDEVIIMANNLEEEKIVNDIVYVVCFSSAKSLVMSQEEEKKYGYDLLNGMENLKIICDKCISVNVGRGINSYEKETKIIPVYPKLNLEDIFLSINDTDSLELLKSIKKLPFSLGDDSILSDDIKDIKKYLLLCKNGIPDINILKNNFPHLQFDNANMLLKDEIDSQLELLKDYIVARFNFYKRNLKLVVSIAKKYIGKIPLEDAFQIGTMGLVKAIDKYDVSKGNKFSTYATWWIRQGISREIADTSTIIRIPVHMTESISKYKKFLYEYNMAHLEEPTSQQCADALGIGLDAFNEVKRASLEVVSLDAPISEDKSENDTIGMFIADYNVCIEKQVVDADRFKRVDEIMNTCLTERELMVLYNRFGVNEEGREMTLEEVGNQLGVTRERVRQIENKALRKVRNRTRNMR